MNPKYKEILAEVDYMIRGLENEYREKIPEKLISFIRKNKANWYEDSIIDIENLNQETYAIMSFLYRKFLANDEEKTKLEAEYLRNLSAEKEKQEITEQHEISYGFVTVTNHKEKEKTTIVPYEEKKWYIKIFEKILNKDN